MKILAEDEKAGVLIIEVSGSDDERMALLEALAAVHGVRSIRERAIKRIQQQPRPRLMGAQKSLDPVGLGLSGDGEIIAVADTGLDTGDPSAIHTDFVGRVAWIKSYPITADYDQYILNPSGNDGPADIEFRPRNSRGRFSLRLWNCLQKPAWRFQPIRGLAYNARLVFQAIEQEMNWSNPSFLSKYGRFMLSGFH